MIAQVTNV